MHIFYIYIYGGVDFFLGGWAILLCFEQWVMEISCVMMIMMMMTKYKKFFFMFFGFNKLCKATFATVMNMI